MGRDASGNVQSEFYRQKAEEAVEYAEESKDPLMRVSWLELAERWMKLIPAWPQQDDEEKPALHRRTNDRDRTFPP